MSSGGLFQEHKDSSDIRNSSNIIHHIHRVKGKITIISRNAKKANEKTPHICMFNNTQSKRKWHPCP